MSSTRNLQSTVTMDDGSGPTDMSRPKPPRQSVCSRMTEESASVRKKVSQKNKASVILPTKGKFTANKSEHVEGSSPKKFVKNTDHSEAEQRLYTTGNQASNDAASSRAQSRNKATKCETDGVLFAKNKRQSFMTESMRSSQIDRKKNENAHDEAENARKASFKKNHATSVFAKEAQSIENRTLKAINVKNDESVAAPSTKSAADVQREKEGRIASDNAENARRLAQAKNARSSVFDSGAAPSAAPRGGKLCSGRPSTASGIFGGGAYADDARKPTPRALAAPSAAPAGFGDNATARSRRDAALRGSGGLW